MNWPRLICKPFGTSVRRVKRKVAFTLDCLYSTIILIVPCVSKAYKLKHLKTEQMVVSCVKLVERVNLLNIFNV